MINPPTTLGAVTLKVADLTKLTDFYRDVVGLQVRTTSGSQVELGTADQPLVILRHLPEGRFVRNTTGLYHLALRVPSQSDLGQWFQHYTSVGAPNWQGASDHGVSEALYLSDPEGNGLEITCDSPRHTWQYQSDGQLMMYVHPLNLKALVATTPSTPWQGIAPETDVGHVHLKVSDIHAARAFYVDALGFEVKTVFKNSALFVANGDYHHHLGLNTWHSQGASPAPAEAYGLAEFVIRWGDQQCVAKLTAANYALTPDGTDMLAPDPAGNLIRLQMI